MNYHENKYKLLSEDEARFLIEQGDMQAIDLYIINTNDSSYYKLKHGDVEKIRKSDPNKASINVVPGILNRKGIKQIHKNEIVGCKDIWVLNKSYDDVLLYSKPCQLTEDSKACSHGDWKTGGEISEMNADKALAIMAWLLSDKATKYSVSGRPNSKVIADSVKERAIQYFGEDHVQFDSFFKRLGKALNQLADEKSPE